MTISLLRVRGDPASTQRVPRRRAIRRSHARGLGRTTRGERRWTALARVLWSVPDQHIGGGLDPS